MLKIGNTLEFILYTLIIISYITIIGAMIYGWYKKYKRIMTLNNISKWKSIMASWEGIFEHSKIIVSGVVILIISHAIWSSIRLEYS